jgi:DNA-binding transcriptional LysR family regulator
VELRQLEHFVAAAEERHFTRAAQRLHIVQSGLSASIRALERELGAPLFVRSTRRVELTQAGRALLPEARRTLAAAAAAGEAVAAVQGLLRGTLAVGTMQILPPSVDLVAVLGRFHAEHPGVELRLRQAGTGTLLEEVRGGALDLALVAPAGRPPKGLTVRRLASDPLLVVCAPTHPLAGRGQVELADLAGEPFVDFQPDWGLRMLVDQQLAAAGLERRTAMEVNDVPTLLELVAHGLGVALVPEVVSRHPAAVRYLSLRPPAPTFEVAVATVDDPPASQAARVLLDMLAQGRREEPHERLHPDRDRVPARPGTGPAGHRRP